MARGSRLAPFGKGCVFKAKERVREVRFEPTTFFFERGINNILKNYLNNLYNIYINNIFIFLNLKKRFTKYIKKIFIYFYKINL